MARRKLEAAIEAGKAIEDGKEACEFFRKVEVANVHDVDDYQDGVYSLQYSPDAKYLIAGFGDGSIRMLDAASGKLKKQLRTHKYQGLPITAIRFNPIHTNVCLATCADAKTYSCDIADGLCQEVGYEKGNEIYTLDFNLEGNSYATAGKDTDVRIYEASGNRISKVYEGYRVNSADQNDKAHAQRIYALKFHPENDHVFITGGWDNHLKIWDIRTREGVMRTIHGPHICGDGLDIKGPYILTGSWTHEKALQIWDFSSGRNMYTISLPDKGKGNFLYSAQFCDKGMALVGGSGTNSVMAVNLRTEQVLGEVPLNDHPVNVLDSIRGGRMFAVGGNCAQIKLAGMT